MKNSRRKAYSLVFCLACTAIAAYPLRTGLAQVKPRLATAPYLILVLVGLWGVSFLLFIFKKLGDRIFVVRSAKRPWQR